MKTLKEMEINKFSSHFEELNEILLKNKIKLLTMKYEKQKFLLEIILNNKEDIKLFIDYKPNLKEVYYKNGKYIASFELSIKGQKWKIL